MAMVCGPPLMLSASAAAAFEANISPGELEPVNCDIFSLDLCDD
jgi:hypothetical protein